MIPGIMTTSRRLKYLTAYALLCFPFLMKYNEINSNTLQVPLSNAFSKGRYGVKAGGVAGPGIRWRFNKITTVITKMVTPATNRNINLSVMMFGVRNQESGTGVKILFMYINCPFVLALDS
jgi:hypothetical protein